MIMAIGKRLAQLDDRLEGTVSKWSRKKLLTVRVVLLLLVAILSTSGAVFLGIFHRTSGTSSIEVALKLNGLTEMTQSQLRKIVTSNHLQIYWAGPEKDARYLLNATNRAAIVLTILPPLNVGRSTRASYSEITTYVVKDAFEAVLNGIQDEGGSGFLNPDGNSVFFRASAPRDVYVGLRGRDIEIEVYDPAYGMSLQIAMGVGTLRPIA